MNILMLGPERRAVKSYMETLGDAIKRTEDKITSGCELVEWADFLVSYGYRHIIGGDVISLFPRRVINLHISFLPWNRGADPNLWSFLEDTPKGVTIHYLDEGLDTGEILARREVLPLPEETLRTSYEKLTEIIELLFMQVWPDILAGRQNSFPQPDGGTSHRLRDRKRVEHLLTQGWDTPVAELIGKGLVAGTGTKS